MTHSYQDNHRILEKLVDREVLHRCNCLIQYLQFNAESTEYQDEIMSVSCKYDEDNELTEALEFYAVTAWFADKLKSSGEMVEEILDFHIWGRTTSGKTISMDGVILEIAAGMGILKGQSNEWSES